MILLACLALPACGGRGGLVAFDPDTRNAPVEVYLVPEHTSVVPGKTLTVGLSIKHQPGYHTYWRHAGVVGLPTNLEWKLPPGFKAGPIRWPRPDISKMAVYTIWGYERDVMLLVDIDVPPTAKPGETVRLKAKAQWMACARDCNPGYADYALDLPVAKEAAPNAAWVKMFARSRREQPAAQTGWTFTARRHGDDLVLTARGKQGANRSLESAYLFDYSKLADSNLGQVFRRTPDGFELAMKVWEYAPNNAHRLEGVIWAKTGLLAQGQATAMRISAPLTVEPE